MICPIVLIRRKRRSRHRTFRRDPGRSPRRNRNQNHSRNRVCLIGDQVRLEDGLNEMYLVEFLRQYWA